LLLFYKNVQSARTQGIEFDFDWAPSRWLDLGGAYTYLDALDTASGLRLTGRHRHQGNIRAGWERAAWGLRSNVRGTLYSDWIAARSGTIDTISPRFAIWNFYTAKSFLTASSFLGPLIISPTAKIPQWRTPGRKDRRRLFTGPRSAGHFVLECVGRLHQKTADQLITEASYVEAV
jgi:hypothetical protein